MHFYAKLVGEEKVAADFKHKAKCYDKKLHAYFYNENVGLYSDFVSL